MLEDDFTAVNATFNVEGGSVGNFVSAIGSEVNISSGTVGFGFDAFNGSTVNISGGDVGTFFDAESGSTINISGGTVGNNFTANDGSTVNIFGAEFFLDGEILDELVLDQAFTIFDRGQNLTLSGLLADGTPFDFNLNSSAFSLNDSFVSGSTLTVTLVTAVPEPGSGLTLATISILLLSRRRRQALR